MPGVADHAAPGSLWNAVRAVRMAKKNDSGTGNGPDKLKRKVYEKELRELQVELCRLQ
eukprot:gene50888-68112_t